MEKENKKKKKKQEKESGFSGVMLFRLILGLGLIFSGEVVFPWVVSGVFRPVLSSNLIKRVGEKSWVIEDLNGKLRFLQNELREIVNGKVSNCSYDASIWEINQVLFIAIVSFFNLNFLKNWDNLGKPYIRATKFVIFSFCHDRYYK